MRPFRILDGALAELDEAATWYEEQGKGLGGELLAEYRERLEVALESPGTGSPAGETSGGIKVRRFHLRRFKRYAILVAVVQGDVPTVVAFEHSSRRPGYWRERSK